jgi:hypothetical protein
VVTKAVAATATTSADSKSRRHRRGPRVVAPGQHLDGGELVVLHEPGLADRRRHGMVAHDDEVLRAVGHC